MLLTTASSCLLADTPARAGGEPGSWPQFRGQGGTAIAPDDNPAPTELDPKKNLLWSSDLPAGHSSPCIVGTQVILTGYTPATQTLEVLSLDRSTGRVRWRKSLAADAVEKVHEISNPAAPTAATDGKRIIVYFGSKGLFAYDADGRELWTRSLPVAVTFRDFGSGTSPIIVGDLVLLDVQLGDQSYLGAWHVASGEPAWKAPRPLYNRGWSTPITWSEQGQPRVGLAAAGRFVAYDPTTGQEVWWLDGLAQQVCSTPCLEAGVLFISSAGVLGERENILIPPTFAEARSQYDRNTNGTIEFEEIPESLLMADRHGSAGAGNMSVRMMLKFKGDKEIPPMDEKAWEEMRTNIARFKESELNATSLLAVRVGGTNELPKEQALWRETRGVPEVPSPLLYRGKLWLVRNGGILTCRDAATGKQLFEERLGAPGGYYASPVAAGGRVYFASDRGVVTVVQAQDKFDVLARNDLAEPIFATPAVLDGQLFVRTHSRLMAFSQSPGSLAVH